MQIAACESGFPGVVPVKYHRRFAVGDGYRGGRVHFTEYDALLIGTGGQAYQKNCCDNTVNAQKNT